MPGLSCSIKYLPCGMQDSSVVSRELLVVACGIWFPDKGLNKGSLHWKCRVLAPRPPGKSSKPLLLTKTLILVLLKINEKTIQIQCCIRGKKVLF